MLCPNCKRRSKENNFGSRFARLLSRYIVTPQSTTGRSPVEIVFGRNLRIHLDLLRFDVGKHVRQQQAKQKQNNDAHAKQRDSTESLCSTIMEHQRGYQE